jgi:hypothetical protein
MAAIIPTDALENAAHAAGFAMVPEDDVAASGHKTWELKSADRSVVRSGVAVDMSARWQGTAQPLPPVNQSSNGIFDWMPSFSWRADGR